MPTKPERQLIAEVAYLAYLASIVSESQMLVDPPTSSESESSDSSSSSDSDSDEPDGGQVLAPSDSMLNLLGLLYSHQYLANRQPINKSGENLRLLLTDWKCGQPDVFRAHVRMTLECFDMLLATLQMDPVFHSQSNHFQMPIEMQLAIALYRFGHYGNAIDTKMVALWAGIEYGTEFQRATLYWPSGPEKEAVKQWVEDNSCVAWQDGWVLVDGTLIPLYARPGFFGNSWYDCKSNYSLNVQIVSTPDLRIVDYSVGLPGSQHDATAFAETCIYKEREVLLGEDEWIWADTAYPLHGWCQAPYKVPEKDSEENTTYNYHVFKLRIRSEYAIGYLKGTW
ncbi:hypothetical protein OG21DRAFT_1556475 [Imleria badia]|nr:hypothetical protein OG21DRAFT_1556475 [Imleria badia]